MKIIGWISPQGELARKPLLGKPCEEYVRLALAACEVHIALQCGLFEDADVALVVRADAPGLHPETLRGLAGAAAGSSSRPSVLIAQDMKTPLAVAMDAPTLRAAAEGESELPSVDRLVENLNAKGVALRVWHDSRSDGYYAVTDAQSYAEAFRVMNAQNVLAHIQSGVIIPDPERVIVEDGVRIGAGTMIYPNNMLCGKTVVGADCVLYPGNRLDGATLGDGATVESSVLTGCMVGKRTVVGPFACLRHGATVGDDCLVGNFVELRDSRVGNGSRIPNLAYADGCDMGEGVRMGSGAVCVSDGGKRDSRAQVGDGAFIGCNCNIVAPAQIGENAYLAAGSTVIGDVPAGALFVARAKGVVKEGWTEGR